MRDIKRVLKISALPLIVIIALLIMISLFTLRQLEDSIENNVIIGMDNSVKSKLELLRSYFDSAIRESFTMTHNPVALELVDYSNQGLENEVLIGMKIRQLEDYMYTIIYQGDIYESIIFIDADGNFVIDASNGAYRDLNYQSMDFYQSARRGLRTIQDVITSPVTGEVVLIVGNPLFNVDNEVIGTAATLIEFDDLVKKIVRSQDDGYHHGVIDRKGHVIAADLESVIFDQRTMQVSPSLFELIKSHKKGHLFADSPQGRQLIVYHVVPEKNWFLYASMPVEEYLYDILPIRRVVISILMFSILILGAVIISTAQLRATNKQYLEALDSLKKTQEELVMSRKIASLGSLVTGVAHEINTPIGNSILVATNLRERTKRVQKHLDDKKITHRELQEFLDLSIKSSENINTSVTKVSNLIKGFKKLSDLKYQEEKQSFTVLSSINEAVLKKKLVLDLDRIDLQVVCEDDIEVYGNKSALIQTLENLIDNTFNHAYDGSYTGIIKIEVRDQKDVVEIRFMDSGRGIDQVLLGKIFDPFFTTKLSGERSGLGLYIVYNTVNYVLNGRIECISDLDAGTEFIITLPKNPITSLQSPLGGI